MTETTDDTIPEEWRGLVDNIIHVLAVIEGSSDEIKIGITRVKPDTTKWLPAGGWCLSIPNLPDLLDEDALEEYGGIYNIEHWDLYISHEQATALVTFLTRDSR